MTFTFILVISWFQKSLKTMKSEDSPQSLFFNGFFDELSCNKIKKVHYVFLNFYSNFRVYLQVRSHKP